jgi:hypothetical protein
MVQTVKWTDAMVDLVRTMAHAGKSTREIAEALSTPFTGYVFTRNMVIGKARREGICLTVVSAPHIVRRQNEQPKPAAPKPGKASMPVIASTPVTAPVAPSEKGMTEGERTTYRQREHARVLDFIERTRWAERWEGVPFMKRKAHECAYLLGAGYQAKVCGKPISRIAYCADHAKLCYTATPRMTAAMRPISDLNVKVVKVKEEVEEADEIQPIDAFMDSESASAL